MSTAKAEIDINAPLETVYDVITDFESYPEFLGETKEVEILESNAKSAKVLFKINIIRKVIYTLEIKMAAPKSVTWHLLEGDLMKKNSGKWKLSEKKGGTNAHYEIDMQFTGLVPKAVSNKLIGSSLPAMMRAFRDRAEDLA
jgi:ribosome-associated toxin RatA of RatAB toxin-antitoxin module